MKTVKVIVVIVILGLVAWGLASLNGSRSTTDNGSIKVGVLIMGSGQAASYGENQQETLSIALDEINKSGGILGRQVQLIYEDGKCDSKEGATAASKLINIDKVDFVISAECSGPTASALPIVKAAKKLYLITAASVPGIADADNYIFRVGPSDAIQGKDLANAVTKLGYKKPAILYSNDEYGKGIKNVFVSNIPNTVEEAFPMDLIDARTNLLKIKDAKPDALVIIGHNDGHYKIVLKQIKELGIGLPLFASESFNSSLLTAGDKSMDGIIATAYSSPQNEKRAELNKEVKEKYGKDIGIFGDFSYDTLYVLKTAVDNAGSFDLDKIRSALLSMSYDGTTGITKFDSKGEVSTKGFLVHQVKNGQFVNLAI
jgi:branched-chain amino acid transport system substrate-binding protein